MAGIKVSALPSVATLAGGALLYAVIDTSPTGSRHILWSDVVAQAYTDLGIGTIAADISALDGRITAAEGAITALEGSRVEGRGNGSPSCLAFWTDANTITSDTNLYWASSTLVAIGDLRVCRDALRIGDSLNIGPMSALWPVGASSTAIGYDARAEASDTVALGKYATATGVQATALGADSVASASTSIAVGALANAAGFKAIVVGYDADASGQDCIAIGFQANAAWGQNICIGTSTTASSSECVVVGHLATSATSESVVLGTQAQAAGATAGAIAIGKFAYATNGGTAIGYQVSATGTRSIFIGDNGGAGAQDSIAMGSDAYIPSGADFAIVIGGNAGCLAASTYSVSIGDSCGTSATGGIAIGRRADSDGVQAVAIGQDSDSIGNQTIAIGMEANAANSGGAICIGYRAGRPSGTARTGSGVLIGQNADPGAAANVVGIGTNVVANGTSSTAVGVSAQATSDFTVAIGRFAQASAFGAIAIGGIAVTAAKTAGIGQTISDSGYAYSSQRYITDLFIGGGSTSTTCEAITVRGSNASGTNIAGADFIIHGGRGTGTAVGGSTRLRVAAPGASGTALNAATDALVASWDAALTRNRVEITGTLRSTQQENRTRLAGGTNIDTLAGTYSYVLIGGTMAFQHANMNLYDWIGIGSEQTINAASALNCSYDAVLIGNGITIEGNASDAFGVLIGHYCYANGYNNVIVGNYSEIGTPASNATSNVLIGYAAFIAGGTGGNIVIGTYASADHSGCIVMGSSGYSSADDEFSVHSINKFMVRNIGTAFTIALNGTDMLTVNSSQQILAAGAGSASLPAYSFVGDPNTGFYSSGADAISCATNGVQRWFTTTSSTQFNQRVFIFSNISSATASAAQTYGQWTSTTGSSEAASLWNQPTIQGITSDSTAIIGLCANRTDVRTQANLTTSRIVAGIAGWYEKGNLGVALGVGGALALTNYYGGYIADLPALAAGVTVTNQYGIYIEGPTRGSTRNRSIHVNAGESYFGGDILIGPSRGLKITEGANATMGVVTLVAGSVTVSTNKVTATSRIFLQAQNGVSGPHALHITARNPGVSFTITSSNGGDISDIAWMIVEPA